MSELREIWTASVQHYHELWVLYVAVVGGLLAFAASENYSKLHWGLRVFLSLAFLAFAYSSLSSLLDSAQLQKATLAQMKLQSNSGVSQDMFDAMKETEPCKLYLMHIIAGSGVVAALWFIPKRDPSDGGTARRGPGGQAA